MTFLELCKQLRREVGETGTGPASVTTATGFDLKLVQMIAEADFLIQSLWMDWDFLWAQASATLSSGMPYVSKPSDHGAWDKNSFFLDYTSATYKQLKHLPYLQWRGTVRNGVTANEKPDFFIIKPDRNLILHPAPNATYSLISDYWKAPAKMTADASLSPIPDGFHRAIIARAKMLYAEHENAPEYMNSGMAEFAEVLARLEGEYLPGRGASYHSADQDGDCVVAE